MSIIQVSDLTFSYQGSYDYIFEQVSFKIDTDWKLGFVGRNGKGKTTFLKLLMGKYPYRGNIKASVVFDYFPYEIAEKGKYTYEVIEEIDINYELWKVKKELNLLHMDEEILYRAFDTLSNGEQTRVMLAVLFAKENNFLLIDEPTNHLDMEARSVVSKYLNSKNGFILISHDRIFLDSCIDHVLSINKMNIEIQKGNFSSWNYNREVREQFEIRENEKLQKEIRQLSEAAKRTEKWSDQVEKSKIGNHAPDRGAIGHKAAKMMKRSKAIESRRDGAAEEKKGLLKNLDRAEELKMNLLVYHQDQLIEAKDLCPVYNGKRVGGKLSFTLNQGERIAIRGKNGSGKSSLLKIILGDAISYEGDIRISTGLKISYVPQNTSTLAGSLDKFAAEKELDPVLFKAVLRKLDFERVQFDKDMNSYSEGQKKKVLLASSICTPAHLYIWDEPLNYVDILSRMQLKELIIKYQPTMIFVEHDKDFVDDIATKTVE